MTTTGFFRVSAAFLPVKVADVEYNLTQTIEAMRRSDKNGAELLVLPELNVSGYTCGDLFNQQILIDKVADALVRIAAESEHLSLLTVVGAPIVVDGRLYNCGVAIGEGKILGVVPKTHLPNYNEFYEKRWFASALESKVDRCRINGIEVPFGTDLLFRHRGACIGIEICEDLWTPAPPSAKLVLNGADIIVNLSATDELIGKHDYLLSLIKGQSARCRCVYAYSSAGPGESSTDAVYAGNAIIAEDGNILAQSPRFTEQGEMVTADCDLLNLRTDRRHYETFYEKKQNEPCRIIPSETPEELSNKETLLRYVDPHPFVPSEGPMLDERCREVTSIQTAGLVQRLRATGCKALTIGISGGLDSTLALLIAVKAFDKLGLDRKGIYAITMPGFGTTHRTHSNALTIMQRLGVTTVEIPIGEAVKQHFKDIGHDMTTHDVTYENCQARERTQILMDYGNKVGAMVLGTGDVSELALGWCTYNADHMSMYSVNCSVPKTLVRHLVAWIASGEKEDKELHDALTDIVATPVSPELIPADKQGNITQKTEDLVGPYELHDFFLYHTIRYGSTPQKVYQLTRKAFGDKYDNEIIKHWMKNFYRRFFNQQFKRSCLPDGPKTGSISLSPRADWRMPSDASSQLWLARLDEI